MDTAVPLACDLNAIPAAERDLHGQRWQQLIGAIKRVDPHGEGYQFTFPIDNPTLNLLMSVVANERLCCPFLHFAIEIAPGAEDMTLTMTGVEGTKALLAMELGLQV